MACNLHLHTVCNCMCKIICQVHDGEASILLLCVCFHWSSVKACVRVSWERSHESTEHQTHFTPQVHHSPWLSDQGGSHRPSSDLRPLECHFKVLSAPPRLLFTRRWCWVSKIQLCQLREAKVKVQRLALNPWLQQFIHDSSLFHRPYAQLPVSWTALCSYPFIPASVIPKMMISQHYCPLQE